MPYTLFISDLHLDPQRPAVTDALAVFLSEHSGRCEALYILGDLFEAWVGDDDDSPLAQHVCDHLAAFSASGSRLYLMHGNRDFLLGQDYAYRCGAELLQDPYPLDLYGTPTLLLHGDTLCTQDTDYLAFRAQARDPDWQTQLLARPLDARRALAAQLRAHSAEATSNKAEDIMDVTPAEVDAVMAQYEVKQMIHGHTHRPARHSVALGERCVLGDWDARGWALKAQPVGIDLYSFPI